MRQPRSVNLQTRTAAAWAAVRVLLHALRCDDVTTVGRFAQLAVAHHSTRADTRLRQHVCVKPNLQRRGRHQKLRCTEWHIVFRQTRDVLLLTARLRSGMQTGLVGRFGSRISWIEVRGFDCQMDRRCQVTDASNIVVEEINPESCLQCYSDRTRPTHVLVQRNTSKECRSASSAHQSAISIRFGDHIEVMAIPSQRTTMGRHSDEGWHERQLHPPQ